MPKTLSDLTLRLSQELSRLEARCARERAAAERSRDRAILKSPARKVLTSYRQRLEKAKARQLDAVRDADDARERATRAAEEKRQRELVKEERRNRDARAKAEKKKRDAIAKAEKKRRDAIAKAKKQPLSKQYALRKAADEALALALEDARDTYNLATEDARLAYRAAIQDDLVDERIAVDKAHRKAERLITGAAITYERAVAQEEARMRRELRAYPDALKVQQSFDREISTLREACEREKEALFRGVHSGPTSAQKDSATRQEVKVILASSSPGASPT